MRKLKEQDKWIKKQGDMKQEVIDSGKNWRHGD